MISATPQERELLKKQLMNKTITVDQLIKEEGDGEGKGGDVAVAKLGRMVSEGSLPDLKSTESDESTGETTESASTSTRQWPPPPKSRKIDVPLNISSGTSSSGSESTDSPASSRAWPPKPKRPGTDGRPTPPTPTSAPSAPPATPSPTHPTTYASPVISPRSWPPKPKGKLEPPVNSKEGSDSKNVISQPSGLSSSETPKSVSNPTINSEKKSQVKDAGQRTSTDEDEKDSENDEEGNTVDQRRPRREKVKHMKKANSAAAMGKFFRPSLPGL